MFSRVGDPQARFPVRMERVRSLEKGEWEAVGTCGELRETSQDPRKGPHAGRGAGAGLWRSSRADGTWKTLAF